MTVEESAKKIIGKDIIVDTNLLTLLLVGRYDLNLITSHKRTSEYDTKDYNFVHTICKKSKSIILNPGIISELSNLLIEDGSKQDGLIKLIREFLLGIDENYTPKNSIIKDSLFEKIGYTDCSIIQFANENNFWVLTDDRVLTQALRENQLQFVSLSEVKKEYFYSKLKL